MPWKCKCNNAGPGETAWACNGMSLEWGRGRHQLHVPGNLPVTDGSGNCPESRDLRTFSHRPITIKRLLTSLIRSSPWHASLSSSSSATPASCSSHLSHETCLSPSGSRVRLTRWPADAAPIVLHRHGESLTLSLLPSSTAHWSRGPQVPRLPIPWACYHSTSSTESLVGPPTSNG